MDLKDLRYAIAVAEAGSFTRAAARLRLAQQALSKQIADLERELDVKLFVRLPRGTRLTPAGVGFVEDARAALAQTQRAMARARGMDRYEAQRFRVGLMPSPMLAEAAAGPLRCFRRRHLLMEIDLLEMAPLALLEAIRDGTVDLGIAWSPPGGSSEIAGECVWERPFGAILPATHPLAAFPLVQWRDLVDLPLITFGRAFNPVDYDWLAGELAHRGLKPRFADVRAAGPPSLVGPFVAEGAGWTLAAAEESWPLYERIPGLVFRPFAESPILAQRWILWSQAADSPLIARFISIWKDLQGKPAIPETLAGVESPDSRQRALPASDGSGNGNESAPDVRLGLV